MKTDQLEFITSKRSGIRIGLIFILFISFLLCFQSCRPDTSADIPLIELSDGMVLKPKIIADNLFVPWEILWGPDGWIWFTQRNGYVKKVHPETGEVQQLLHIKDNYEWTSSGTLGMVLHPDFESNPYVYLVYTYSRSGKPNDINNRLVRYTYDPKLNNLDHPVIFLDSLNTGPGGTYGSRLLITEDEKLIMTIGGDSMGAGDTISLLGKTLRLELEDGSIPDDNPYKNSYVYTRGHRNPQGLTVTKSGILYSSEHGPTSDDEINQLIGGRHYGWPYVMGTCDKEIEKRYCDSAKIVESVYNWTPTIAPCGLIYYDHEAIPSWKNSLLLATLKESDLRVLKLSDDEKSIVSETIYLDRTLGRIRDLCISPEGVVYLSTSHFEREVADLNMSPRKTKYDKIIGLYPVNQ